MGKDVQPEMANVVGVGTEGLGSWLLMDRREPG